MKMKFVIMMFVATIVLSGCVKEEENNILEFEDKLVQDEVEMQDELEVEDDIEDETDIIDDSIYIGEYLDYDVNEPNLEIAKGEDGKYIVQIGIYRLTTLEDGIGELTEDGMIFTATDAAGNPISGIITVDGETATVTFTDSTWDLIQNGDIYEYNKSSDEPNIWDY